MLEILVFSLQDFKNVASTTNFATGYSQFCSIEKSYKYNFGAWVTIALRDFHCNNFPDNPCFLLRKIILLPAQLILHPQPHIPLLVKCCSLAFQFVSDDFPFCNSVEIFKPYFCSRIFYVQCVSILFSER